MAEKKRRLWYKTLVKKGACHLQRSLFHRRYGSFVDVTQSEVERVCYLFDFYWAHGRLLSDSMNTLYYHASENWEPDIRHGSEESVANRFAWLYIRDTAWGRLKLYFRPELFNELRSPQYGWRMA